MEEETTTATKSGRKNRKPVAKETDPAEVEKQALAERVKILEAKLAQFEANPRAYAPVFGGYCAYAVSQGYLAHGDPRLWRIEDGELFLLNNASVEAIWQAAEPELMQAARGNWPAVLRD